MSINSPIITAATGGGGGGEIKQNSDMFFLK